MQIEPETQEKYTKLLQLLSSYESVAVAYSGGVDSSFLAQASQKALGDNSFAVLGISPTVAASEIKEARDIAVSNGFQLVELPTNELTNPNYVSNPVNRCYFCKSELFNVIKNWADQHHIKQICDGANADDESDYRPGSQAAEEYGVTSPLAIVGLTKAEIRTLSRQMNLNTWDKPSIACLGSRFPYGTSITIQALSTLDEAESFIRSLGFRQLRIRLHGDIARIEVSPEDIEKISQKPIRDRISEKLKSLGYKYITLDLVGYRTGSLNEII